MGKLLPMLADPALRDPGPVTFDRAPAAGSKRSATHSNHINEKHVQQPTCPAEGSRISGCDRATLIMCTVKPEAISASPASKPMSL